MADEHATASTFRHTVFSGLPDEDDAPALPDDEEREVDQQLREISDARAEAAIHSRDYLIR